MALTEIEIAEVDKDIEAAAEKEAQNAVATAHPWTDTRVWNECIEVAVAVGKGSSSKEALKWVLESGLLTPGGIVHLLHIQAPLRFIPSPMGNLIPIDGVSEEMANKHKLQRFLTTEHMLCTYKMMCDEKQVCSEVVYAEGDVIYKELVNQISSLCIAKLVIGMSSHNRISRALKKQSIASSVRKNAPSFCKVVVVCNGKVQEKGKS